MKKYFISKGFTLIELVIAVGLFMIIAGGLGILALGSYANHLEETKRLQASALLVESWEALQSVRSRDWSLLTNGVHGLATPSGYWELSGDSDVFESISRRITISDIERDAQGNIVSGGGMVDPDSKAVQIDLTWSPSDGQIRSLSTHSVITNYANASNWP